MIKLLSFFIIFLSTTALFAQEEVLKFSQDDGNSNQRKKDGFTFSNELNGDLAIVFFDRKNVFANLVDKNLKKKASAAGKPQKSKYTDLLGYQIIANQYILFATNSKKKKFAIQIIDFDNNTTESHELELDFGNEKFIETIQYKNQLYLLTGTKDNTIILRKMSSNFNFDIVKKFDIAYEERSQKLLKSGFLEVGLFGPAESNIVKIDTRVPNAIEQVAKPNKLYQINNEILLTIEDDENLATILHRIDLELLTLKTNIYAYVEGEIDALKKYNSFILNDKIFQMGSSRDEMVFVIKSFDNTILKKFYVERNSPIQIKNSPIIQEGAALAPFVNRREMEETSKYLRKITSGDIGITGYLDRDQYILSIGGYKTINHNGGMMIPGAAGMNTMVLDNTGVVYAAAYNPTNRSFNNYSTTKSTYFNTRLDANFEYVKKEDDKNIFDRIKDFKKTLKYETAEYVFFHEGSLYFGYFNGKMKTYHLHKM